MRKCINIVGRTVFCLAVLFSSRLWAEDDTLAVTYNFTGSGGFAAGGQAGTPVAATSYFNPSHFTQNNSDQVNTATHELFHGVGFAAAYNNFFNKLFATPGAGANGIPVGSRVYSTNGTVGGIKMVLVPSSSGTHSDPAATGAAPWPATGYNQSSDLMQPTIFAGATLNATDASVMNDAFSWSTSGILVKLVNHDTADFNGQALTNVLNAITAVQNLFNGANPAPANPNFTWELVPEPSCVMILFVIGTSLATSRRRVASYN